MAKYVVKRSLNSRYGIIVQEVYRTRWLFLAYFKMLQHEPKTGQIWIERSE